MLHAFLAFPGPARRMLEDNRTMRLESARGLKEQLLREVVEPFVAAGKPARPPRLGFLRGRRASARHVCPNPSHDRSRRDPLSGRVQARRPCPASQPAAKPVDGAGDTPGQGRSRDADRRPHRQTGARASRAARGPTAAAAVIPWYQQNTQTTPDWCVGRTRRRHGGNDRRVRQARQRGLSAVEQSCSRERGSAHARPTASSSARPTTAGGSRPSVSRGCVSGSG